MSGSWKREKEQRAPKRGRRDRVKERKMVKQYTEMLLRNGGLTDTELLEKEEEWENWEDE
jgi:hypothetical protein